MTILLHAPAPHELLELQAWQSGALHVVRGGARGAHVAIPPNWISLWLPLSGQLELRAAECRWLLPGGRSLIWREGALQAGNRRDGWWLAVCADPATWRRYMPPGTASDIFPDEGRCPRELRRQIVRLVRELARGADRLRLQATTETLCAGILEDQRHLATLLDRCSGRTRARRQQTLMRLLRVRHLIRRHENGRLDLSSLAARASYSPCHLIRSYRDVFGETPSEYASRLRVERAWRLVNETTMPICEITEMLGFESQSGFCRAFKNSFGATTSEIRREHAVQPPPSRREPMEVSRAA